MLPLRLLLGGLIKEGTLTVIDSRGRAHRFGGGLGPSVTIRLHKASLPRRLLLRPELTAGEAYMDGSLTVEEGDILDFLNLIARNAKRRTDKSRRQVGDGRIRRFTRKINNERRARRNVAHHYEFRTEFYDLFLGETRQYSCAYFRSPDDSLDQAQHNKLDHIAGKLLLEPHHRVLDIGCGWGTLARHLHAVSGAHVTGVTLAQEQLRAARAMAEAEGNTDVLDYRLEDYRRVKGPFDRVVSVGMFEAVGIAHYDAYFRTIHDQLADDGIAMVHTIGRSDGPGGTNDWTEKYIFPGGYSPALSEVMPAIERSGLFVTDIEVWRTHYARTAEHWYRRFQQHRDQIRVMYDERFCRMFEFFLAGCVGAFDHGGLVVFQIQLAKKVDGAPLARDYLYAGRQPGA